MWKIALAFKVDDPPKNDGSYTECEDCEYARQAECFPCGSEDFPKKCDYMYAWCQTLEELAQLREVINFYDSMKSDCIDKQCNHKKDSVFCVKNYSL